MRNFHLLLLLLILNTACGTAVKMQSTGDLETSSRTTVPLVMQYKLEVAAGKHEFFFWDENKNRFNVAVPAGTKTEDGIVVYLPAGRSYALSSFLIVRPSGRLEFPFGTDLNLFRPQAGQVNALPRFEMVAAPNDRFSIRQTGPVDERALRRAFPQVGKIHHLRVRLIE